MQRFYKDIKLYQNHPPINGISVKHHQSDIASLVLCSLENRKLLRAVVHFLKVPYHVHTS